MCDKNDSSCRLTERVRLSLYEASLFSSSVAFHYKYYWMFKQSFDSSWNELTGEMVAVLYEASLFSSSQALHCNVYVHMTATH